MTRTDTEIRADLDRVAYTFQYRFRNAWIRLATDVAPLMAEREAALAKLSRSRESANWLVDRAWAERDAALAEVAFAWQQVARATASTRAQTTEA